MAMGRIASCSVGPRGGTQLEVVRWFAPLLCADRLSWSCIVQQIYLQERLAWLESEWP